MRHFNKTEKTTDRHGTTLAEVLVSIMILSIGIISLATLFPISILRSLQATQLTNATILRYNAEAQIEVTPSLVYDPDGNGTPNSNSNYVVDPLGYSRPATATPGTMGGMLRHPGLPAFDPAATGNDPATADINALTAVTLPDSWVFQVDGTGTLVDGSGTAVADPAATPASSFVFDEVDAATLQQISTGREIDVDGSGTFNGSEVDRNGNGIFDVEVSRIVLFDTSGRRSQVRTITGISGQTVSWSGPINYPVGIARIETAETRYTWMLTVRNNSSGLPSVDVVVFFRRAFSLEDETAYDATFINGNRRVGLIVPVGSEPNMKKGGFVLDVRNSQWYRIQDIERVTGNPSYTHFLEIERPADGSAGEDWKFANFNGVLDTDDPTEDANMNNDLDFGKALFMEGVIEVYPLGVK